MSAARPALVRIVAPPAAPGSPAKTMGTVVLLADGSHLPGVTGIRLFCELNSVWRAEITLNCDAPDIAGVEAVIIPPDKRTWLRRFWDWLMQDQQVDITTLQSHDRKFGRR